MEEITTMNIHRGDFFISNPTEQPFKIYHFFTEENDYPQDRDCFVKFFFKY